ncbi:MAG: F0F1 ATP synthase subunit epsilon [Crocinitomicaceae bacterium]|jgi:F-type H+-transporting ATPase subunit epsilon|nr:F0F1 ATP synthase subunit epsilon [Crocinitomicaceae bacterium]
MQLEIITPETKIFTGEVNAVQFPGLDGSFQVLAGHAPIIAGLNNGIVKVDLPMSFETNEKVSPSISIDKTNSKVIHVTIKGGVMELLNDKIIVLAE